MDNVQEQEPRWAALRLLTGQIPRSADRDCDMCVERGPPMGPLAPESADDVHSTPSRLATRRRGERGWLVNLPGVRGLEGGSAWQIRSHLRSTLGDWLESPQPRCNVLAEVGWTWLNLEADWSSDQGQDQPQPRGPWSTPSPQCSMASAPLLGLIRFMWLLENGESQSGKMHSQALDTMSTRSPRQFINKGWFCSLRL